MVNLVSVGLGIGNDSGDTQSLYNGAFNDKWCRTGLQPPGKVGGAFSILRQGSPDHLLGIRSDRMPRHIDDPAARSTNGYKIFAKNSSNVYYDSVSASSDATLAANIRHFGQQSRMQTERGTVDVHGHGEAEGSMLHLANVDPEVSELHQEAYSRWRASEDHLQTTAPTLMGSPQWMPKVVSSLSFAGSTFR